MKYIITIIIAIILITGFLIWQGVYYPLSPNSSEEKVFLVKRGQDAKEIADSLERAGLIRYSFTFRVYVSISKQSNNLKAGEYNLSPSMTVSEIVDKIISGDMIKKNITIIEGWTIKDIGNYFEKKEVAILEQLIDLDNKERNDNYFKKDFTFLSDKTDDLGLEGYLFPDTYEFSPEDGLEDIIRMMLDSFDNKLSSELRADILSQEKTIFDIVTMASLIEKEVRTIEDKKMVSGILWNRLKIGMPLQVDSTITYITGRNSTEILKEELELDSLYNTYKYKGLPLGPICNPGIDSIDAAIHPTDNDYLFYLSTPEGETIFNKTLKEHNEAINKYLK